MAAYGSRRDLFGQFVRFVLRGDGMKSIAIDEKWRFRRGFLDSIGMLDYDPGVEVNLPHDGMIGTKVSPDARQALTWGILREICRIT